MGFIIIFKNIFLRNKYVIEFEIIIHLLIQLFETGDTKHEKIPFAEWAFKVQLQNANQIILKDKHSSEKECKGLCKSAHTWRRVGSRVTVFSQHPPRALAHRWWW